MAIFHIFNTIERSYPEIWENPVLKAWTEKEQNVTTDVYLSNSSQTQGHTLANL